MPEESSEKMLGASRWEELPLARNCEQGVWRYSSFLPANSSGYGASNPRTECQRIRLSVSSSAASPSSRSSSSDFFAQYSALPRSVFSSGFISSRRILLGMATYGVKSGSAAKQRRIGVAD